MPAGQIELTHEREYFVSVILIDSLEASTSKMSEALTTTAEQFHNQARYEALGLDDFLDHAKGYLAGERTIPVSKAPSIDSAPGLIFTFTNALLEQMTQGDQALEKAYQITMKYGFRGHSRGGRNGVFYQRAKDTGMLGATERLILANQEEVMADLSIAEKSLDSLEKLRVVWHRPSGKRMVGAYNPKNHRAIFLGFATY